jgi:hypothetical protein
MSANQAFFAIATMARVLGVSTAGYYAWRSRLPSARVIADDALLRRVRTIHAVSRGTYGAPRVYAELRAQGRAVGKKRIARLMRAAGIVGVSRRRAVITTRRDRDARPGLTNLRLNARANGPDGGSFRIPELQKSGKSLRRCLGQTKAVRSSARAGAVDFALVSTKPSHEFWITSIIGHVDYDLGRWHRQGLAFGAGDLVVAHVAAIPSLGFEEKLDRIRVAGPDIFDQCGFG